MGDRTTIVARTSPRPHPPVLLTLKSRSGICRLVVGWEQQPVASLVSPTEVAEVDAAFQDRRGIATKHHDVYPKVRCQLTLCVITVHNRNGGAVNKRQTMNFSGNQTETLSKVLR